MPLAQRVGAYIDLHTSVFIDMYVRKSCVCNSSYTNKWI